MPTIKRAKSEFVVRYLGVSYDDFRKEVWVSSILQGLTAQTVEIFSAYMCTNIDFT